VATLAGVLGISSVYLMQLSARQGGREPSPELCVRIENATYQQVKRWDLRPADWDLIWPELITAQGAPAVEDRKAA
jgi:DNA-binding transcriptional regulator YdaS (Cro superfamily)